MFDNLKDKLGSFREDAEEAAEENAEEVDEEELEEAELDDVDDPETTQSDTAEADASELADDEPAETVAASTADPDSELEEPNATGDSVAARTAESTGQEPATDADPDFGEEAAESEAEPAVDDVEATGDAEEPAAAEAETDDDDRSGLGAKARSLFSGSSDESEPAEADADEPAADEAVAETAVDENGVDEDEADEDEADEGDDAAETGGTGFGTKAKSLVKGKFVIEEDDLEGPLRELEMALLSSDVEMGVAEEILDNIRDELVGETRTFTTSTGEVVEEALHNAIYDVISVGQFDFDERIAVEDTPVTIIFTGVNGVGKTTSIAKLSRYFEERGYSTVMANGDTYRAGANQQIQEHADALDTKCISHEQGGDPAAVLYDAVEYAEANDVDIVLGDTAGRLHTNEGLMDQLEKIERVVGPDMTLFVDEAVAGQDAVNRAREFNDAAEIDGAILTKADADSNGGAAISVAHVTGKPILFLGVGQGYDDLERFDPDEMVDRLLAAE
ncbi:signal recognition particle-docking protein FtsY [Natrinema marinum]|uniref:signal recognition particle-docking protein FtsY n=1 Tax=Natrinema marinum TaxID=2961598 RepID=UPI0020C8EE2C|nr:signal recognition particle-docking protein FtsY [Natrinema marinum]